MKMIRRLLVEKKQMSIFATGLYMRLECGHTQWGDPFGRESKYVPGKPKVQCGVCSRHAAGCPPE